MKIRRNITLFKLYYLSVDLWPLITLAVVYFRQITGSYVVALGMFSIMNIVQSLTEVPTGIISDRIGRKKTMMVSSFLSFISFLIFALAGNLRMVNLLLLGAIIRGIANSFVSGTDDAFMYETMQELRKEEKYDIIYARSKTFSQIGKATGALIAAGVTYFYSLNLLAWVSAVLELLCFAVTLFFIEPTIHTKEDITSWKHFIAAWKAFLINKKLRILAIIQMLNRGISSTSHRLEGAYFNMLVPTWIVNIARVIKQLCGTISFSIAPYFRKLGFYRILVGSTIGMSLVHGIAVVMNNYATPFISSCVNVFYGTSTTAESALLQKELSSKQRATMGSIVSFVGGIFLAIIYYFVGLIADASSVYWAFVMLIICSGFISAAYYWMLKKYE